MSEMIKLQANVAGFQGQSCTLLSVFDPENRVLRISKLIQPKRVTRIEGCKLLSTDRMESHDALFSDEIFSEAIQAFQELDRAEGAIGKRLLFDLAVERARPNGVIESDGYDENGPKLRIAESVSCEQAAVLATCWFALRQSVNSDVISMFERLNGIYAGLADSVQDLSNGRMLIF